IFLFSALFRLCLLRRLGRLGRLRFGFLLSLIFTGISDFLESFSRAIGLTGFRETPQEILERGLCVIGPVEIFFLNSADGEERLAAISAAGILLQEKIVRIDRGLEVFRIEVAAHFLVQLAFSDERRRHFFGLRRDEIHLVVGGDGLPVIGERAIF